MAILSVKNIGRRTPLTFVRIKRFVNIGLIPVVIVTLKGLWVGDETQLNKILLIITITIPGLMEALGMLLAEDTVQVDTEDVKSVSSSRTPIAPDGP